MPIIQVLTNQLIKKVSRSVHNVFNVLPAAQLHCKCVLAPAESSGNSPGIGLLVSVVERLETLLFLLFAEASRVGYFEEGWRELHQPAWVDCRHLSHILFGGQHQFMVYHPERRWKSMLHRGQREQQQQQQRTQSYRLTSCRWRGHTTQVVGWRGRLRGECKPPAGLWVSCNLPEGLF